MGKTNTPLGFYYIMNVIRTTYRYGLFKGIRDGCYVMRRRNELYNATDSGCLSKVRVDELNLLKCTKDKFNEIGKEICNVPINKEIN